MQNLVFYVNIKKNYKKLHFLFFFVLYVFFLNICPNSLHFVNPLDLTFRVYIRGSEDAANKLKRS